MKLPDQTIHLAEPAPMSAAMLVAPIERHLALLQSEIEDLQVELRALRGQDETLKFYMNRVDEEMRLAARLQQDFLPKKMPDVGRVSFQTLFRPAGYVSGDLYDVMRLDETHVGFYMADAVGHGMPAALLTMFLKNALVTKQITESGYSLLPPSQTMARLNQVLFEQHLSHATFATAIYGTIDVQSLVCTFARGGHPSPFLQHADGTIDVLEGDGSLLGIFSEETFADSTVQLASGDRLFIYSDGVEVGFGMPDGQPMSGEQWKQQLVERRSMSSKELIADVSRRIESATGSLAPKDDLTMIIVDVT